MNNNQKFGSILVTGASSGIGKAISLHLEQLGFSVFATVRNERDANALCSQTSGGLVPVLMDVTDQASIERAKNQVNQAIGDAGLDGLVNNAGVVYISPLEFVPLDELRWLFEVNFFGLLAVTQAFLPLLRKKQGRIVNISSMSSIFIIPFHGAYTASKLGVDGLSEALRLELKPHGVQVSVVVCGNTKTPIWDKSIQISDRIAKDFPSKAMDLYGGRYGRLREYFIKIGDAGIQPEAVSRKIVHALTAQRARKTYYVGPDASLFRFLDKILHGRLRDWFVLHPTV